MGEKSDATEKSFNLRILQHNSDENANETAEWNYRNGSKQIRNASNVSVILKTTIDQQWLACEILNIIMSAVLGYVVISLFIYHKRKGLTNFAYRVQSKIRSKRFEIALDCLTFAAALFAFVRVFTDIDGIVGRDSVLNCSCLKKPKVFISFVSFGCICVNYWLRQRIIHGNKQLNHLSSPGAKAFGVVFLVAMSLLCIANLVLFMIKDPSEYQPIKGIGCTDGNDMIPFYILAFTSVSTQITLVVLLIFPLIKRGNSVSSKLKMKREHRLIKMIFRTFITAVVGVVFTVVGLVVLAAVPVIVDDLPMLVINVNLFVLVFCGIFTFADSAKRLFPFGNISTFNRSSSLSVRSVQRT